MNADIGYSEEDQKLIYSANKTLSDYRRSFITMAKRYYSDKQDIRKALLDDPMYKKLTEQVNLIYATRTSVAVKVTKEEAERSGLKYINA